MTTSDTWTHCDKCTTRVECSLQGCAATLSQDEAVRLATEMARNALRYEKLRAYFWHDNVIAVVMRPKDSLKLGAHCPFGQHLDEILDNLPMPQRALPT